MSSFVSPGDFENWQSRQHFDFSNPWEHVEFAVYSSFDVVAGPGWRISQQRQGFNELWWVSRGSVEVRQNEILTVCHAPGAVLLRERAARDTRQLGEAPLAISGFSFGATLWGALDLLDFVALQTVWAAPTPQFGALISRLVEEATTRGAGYNLAIGGLGQLALVEIWRAQGTPDAQGTPNGTVRGALQIAQSGELHGALQLVAKHFDRPLDVEQMARACHLSTKHFGRKFHAALGVTPMEHLRRVRLSRARALLAAGDDAVGQIAYNCGFESAAHFSRAFRAGFGASPLQFRRDLRAMTRNSSP